jgi:hypothetical protein
VAARQARISHGFCVAKAPHVRQMGLRVQNVPR